ncbi:MAG: hypothetical protein ACFFAE_02355 [Candidatus Hodarchaeota archaeon]
MLKKREFRLLITISLFFMMLLPYFCKSVASPAYSKTWTHLDGSKLEITISSFVTNLVVDTRYTYKVVLEAKTFGSNLDGFYSIAVGLRFTSLKETIESDLKCDIGDLTAINSKIHVLIHLPIPSADEISLGRGESVQGNLQYIVYYSEQPKDWDKSEMAPNQWPHESDTSIGWETISQGKISNPFIDFNSLFTIIIISVSLISVMIIIYTIVRKRSSTN